MKSIENSKKVLDMAVSIYIDIANNLLPQTTSGRVYPEKLSPTTYLDDFFTTADLTSFKDRFVAMTGKDYYSLTPLENSILHMILVNAILVKKELLDQLKLNTSSLTEIIKSSRSYLYEFADLNSDDLSLLKSFLDLTGKKLTVTQFMTKFQQIEGFQLINSDISKVSLENCDVLLCNVNLSDSSITTDKYASSTIFYNSTVSLGYGVNLTGCRFVNCTLEYAGGQVIINENSANSGKTSLFSNCNVPTALKNNMVDRDGNSITNNLI